MNDSTSHLNHDGSVTVSVDLILSKLGEQISEQAVKIATLQCTNAALQNEISKLTLQIDQAQKMVNSMLKEKTEANKMLLSQPVNS